MSSNKVNSSKDKDPGPMIEGVDLLTVQEAADLEDLQGEVTNLLAGLV